MDGVRSPRNPGIDLLRGLSIVLVVMHHTALRIPLEKGVLGDWLPPWLLYGIQYDGFEAVFLFFVISGFLIASNSLERWGTLAAIEARTFYRRRAARILPCLLILVAVLSALALAGAPHYTMAQPKQTLGGVVWSALSLRVNVYQADTGWLPAGWGVLWSLSIEEVFYLAFPIVCVLLGRTRLLVPALLVLALSIPVVRGQIHHDEIWAEENYLQGMAAIATGVLAALLVRRWPAVRRSTAHWTLALGVVGLLAVFFAGTALWHSLRLKYMLVLTASAAALVIASRWRAGFATPPPWRAFGWLRSFGRLSYEIYLTHMFVIWLVVDRFDAAGGDLHRGVAWYPPVLVGSWVLGWLVERLVSAPLARAIAGPRASRAPARGDALPRAGTRSRTRRRHEAGHRHRRHGRRRAGRGEPAMIELRAFRPDDAPALRGVFESAIHGVAIRDYTSQQVHAWAPREHDAADWAEHMRDLAPFVALQGGQVVGYADVQPDGYIDHLFVSAAAGGQGVGGALMRRLLARASELGLAELTSHVSLTAQPFFAHFGFEVVEHRVVDLRGVEMRNAAMRKTLR